MTGQVALPSDVWLVGLVRAVQKEQIEAVRQDVSEKPRIGLRVVLAKKHNMAKATMSNLVRKDLNLASCAVTKVQTLTASQRQT